MKVGRGGKEKRIKVAINDGTSFLVVNFSLVIT